MASTSGRHSDVALLGFAAAVLGLVLAGVLPVLAWQHETDTRALDALTPLIDAVLAVGLWLSVTAQEHALQCALVALGVTAPMAFLAWRSSGWPAAALMIGMGTALCAESLVVSGRIALGVAAFSIGLCAALVVSRQCSWPREDGGAVTAERSAVVWGERGMVAVLTVIGMVAAVYGDNQHPAAFLHEMIATFVQSSSLAGIREFFVSRIWIGNSSGFVEMPVLWGLTKLFGSSLLTVRLTPALAAAVTVPLLWAFVRRLAGTVAATVAAALFATSPAYLWFARTDYTNFAYIAPYAIVIAWLSLEALERESIWRWLVVVALMGGSRFVYTAGQVAWMIPVALVLHAALVERRGKRPGWLPWLSVAVGSILWFTSATLLLSAVEGRLRWMPAVGTYGAAVWQQSAAGAGTTSRILTTVTGVAENVVDLGAGMFANTRYGEEYWYRWSHRPGGALWAVSAAAALMVPAVGWLLGRWRDRRAALLLAWMAISLIPGCASNQIGVRRVLMLFPPVYAAIGIAIAALLGILRVRGRPGLRRTVAVAVGALVFAISLVGINSTLRATYRVPVLVHQARFLAPLLERNELVVHDLPQPDAVTLAYFNLDAVTDPAHRVLLQFEPRERWPYIGLRPEARGDANYLEVLGLGAQARRWAADLDPGSILFMLRDIDENRATIEALGGLYGEGTVRRGDFGVPTTGLWTIEVAGDAIRSAGHLECVPDGTDATAFCSQVLAGIPATVVVGADPEGPRVRGGLVVPDDGWYGFSWSQACPAILDIDGEATQQERMVPLVAGVHRLAIRLSDEDGCRAGLDLSWRRFSEPTPRPIDGGSFTAPRVAEVEQFRPEPAAVHAGWEGHSRFAGPLPEVWDMAGTPDGGVAVMVRERGVWTVRRFAVSGSEGPTWQVPLGLQSDGVRLAVSGSGGVAALGRSDLVVMEPGREPVPYRLQAELGRHSDLTFAPDGSIWMVMLDARSLLRVPADLGPAAVYRLHELEDASQLSPVGVDIDEHGDIVVLYNNGRVHRIRFDRLRNRLELVGSFQVRITIQPQFMRSAVTSDGWLHVTFRPSTGYLTYDGDGHRRLAGRPDRGLLGREIERTSVIAAAGNDLFIYDDATGLIWRVTRAR